MKLPGSLPPSEKLLRENITQASFGTPRLIIYHNIADASILIETLESTIKCRSLAQGALRVRLCFVSHEKEIMDDNEQLVHVVASEDTAVKGRLGFPDLFPDNGLSFYGGTLDKILILTENYSSPSEPPAYSPATEKDSSSSDCK